MKRLIIPAALCCMLMACGGNGGNNAAQGTDNGSAIENTKASEADKNTAYTMVDGKLFELKGKVKSCKVDVYMCDKDAVTEGTPIGETLLEFDADGKFTKNSAKQWFEAQRNGKGQVIAYTQHIDEYDCDIYDSLFYNADGFVERMVFEGVESMSENLMKYDGGELESMTCDWAGEGENGLDEYTYTILESDEKGNWTKRIARDDTYEWQEGDDKPEQPDSFSYTVEIREIVYY